MQQRRLGDTSVSAIGVGAMPMSTAPYPDRERSLRTLHAAFDAGVTLVDTADAYCAGADDVGHNERLVAEALATWGGDRDSVLVATKGGHVRTADDGWALDGRPEHLRRACEASLQALGVEAIGLYQFHRPDPQVPWAESVGAIEQLRQEGKVRLVGVSNADPDRIREGARVTTLAAVQNELSPRFRTSEPEVALCEELGVAFLPWSPFGGMASAGELGSQHWAFGEVAVERGVSPQQVCLAWLLAMSPQVVPIPGASRPESVLDSVAAVDLELSEDDLARLAGS